MTPWISKPATDVLERISDGFYAVDSQWRLTYINRQAEGYLGRPASEMLGQVIWDLFPATRTSPYYPQFLAAVADGRAITFEDRSSLSDRWVSGYALPMDGGLWVFFRDDTSRKRNADRSRFLIALDDAVRPLTDPSAITQTAARLLGEHLGVDRCAYADVDVDEDWMSLNGNYTRDASVPSIVGRLRFSDFGAEVLRLMRANEPFVVADVETHTPQIGDLAAYRAAQIRAVVCVPLHKQGRLRAAMAVHTNAPRTWREDEVELVCAVAARCWESIERARLSRELSLSAERLETVVRGANVGVWFCPLPFGDLIWDETVKRHFHLAPDDPVTIDTFYERLHPDDAQRTRATIEQSIRDRSQFDILYRTVSPDGQQVKWVRASGRATYDAAGNATAFDGITIDATAQVETQERLREESAVVETIHRIGRSVAAELDLERLVQSVTDATTQLTGAQFGAFFYNVITESGEAYSLYALSGVDRSHFEKFPMPRNTEIFAPTFSGRGVLRLDDVTVDPRYGRNQPFHGMPEGHLPVRSYLAVPVVSRSGEVLGGLFFGHAEPAMFTERTERLVVGIAAQAAVAIDNARLFEVVQRANADKDALLESERLARAEVERASRMKDEFLATLSHELRTPLNAIYGWSQILLRTHGELSANIRQGLETIERNARAQTQIIEDLLDMSRIISGKVRLDVQRVSLAPVIEAAVETVRHSADAKGVRMQVMLDPKAGPISGDPQRLQQVLWNLLSNAIKFTPKHGRVQVLLERVNSHLEVSVIDTGEGIAPEFLPHVFDRFRQADASTTRPHGGLGLGLAIAKNLIELHGGSIRVKSPGLGQGSTFSVALPLAVLHPGQDDPAPRQHPASTPPHAPIPEVNADLSEVSVLVVDDEPDARELIRRLLEARGADVVTAGSVAEAWQLITTQRFRVLVSDIGMPGEDGYSLVRRVRELGADAGGDLPAIALTAYARAEDRIRSVLAGFQMHVSKPVEPAELIATVANLAGRT